MLVSPRPSPTRSRLDRVASEGKVERCRVFQKLLVPLDGSAESAVALPLARLVAAATGARVRLLRVINPRGDSARQAELAEAHAYLTRMRDELEPGEQPVETAVQQ